MNAADEEAGASIPPLSRAKRRRVWLAALLSLLCPGLGQLYNARPRRGIAVFGLAILGAVPFWVLWTLPPTFAGFIAVVIGIAIFVVVYVFALIDAVLGARRAGTVTLTRFNRVWIYCASIVAWGLTGQIPSLLDVKWHTYSIPSAAMLPTIEVGDYVVAWQGFYRSHEPERGQVAVFKLARDGRTDYVKRIVGLPGDRIQMKGGVLYINGAPVPKAPTENFVYRDDGQISRLPQFVWTLPNGRQYRVIEQFEDAPLNNMPIFNVPPGHYFVMGDNRDNSSDSRDAHSGVGFVRQDTLRDLMCFVIWAKDWHRIGRTIE